mgnify:FL=1
MLQYSPPVDYIDRTSKLYAGLGYPQYEWVKNTSCPELSVLKKPLEESKAGLICSGGIYRKGQIAFHFKDDISYRMIETNTEITDIRTTHFAYDLTSSRKDPNCVFPLASLREFVASGKIKSLAQHAITFMGGIYSHRRVREILAPSIRDYFIKQEVDLAILVPV